MKAIGVAERIGVSEEAFEKLLKGDVPNILAENVFGTNGSSLQRFVDGEASIAVADKLRISETALQELRDAIGREGAIGLLIGLSARHK